MEILSNIKEFFAGDNLKWVVSTKELSSVNDYALQVVLISSSNPKIEYIADGQADGSWLISRTPNETADLLPGRYNLFFRFYKSSEGFAQQAPGGYVEVKPNILTNENFDYRTANQKLLDIVRERIAGRLTEGMSAFTINGRSVTLIPFLELLQIEKELEAKVSKELATQELKNKGKTNRNKLKIRTGIFL